MMKVFSLFTTALALALALPAGMASAKDCVPTCGAMKRTCQKAAVGDFRSCRLDARANAPGGARRDAMRACRDAFRTAHQSCLTDLRGCLNDCRNAPPEGSCDAGCVATGKTCVQGVLDQGQSCAAACPPPGHDRGCRLNCAQQAKSGLEDCASMLRDCLSGCGASTTTSAPTTTTSTTTTTTTMAPSPSGAFLD